MIDHFLGSGNPLKFSPLLGRKIRQDDLDTLGISTQTWVESTADRGDFSVAAELVDYYWEEMWRLGDVLYLWLEDILGEHLRYLGLKTHAETSAKILRGLRVFDVAEGDRTRAVAACAAGDPTEVVSATEAMRVSWIGIHDALVRWVQELLSDLAVEYGEDAVLTAVERSYERVWSERYTAWDKMEPIERLRISVEAMRGHLSGPQRRGDVGVIEEEDRFIMVLDPCGSCGVLRRGDPESGRPPVNVQGNQTPKAWTWNRTGVGWYASHSPIVMEYLWTRDGKPPMRPHRGCDQQGPCQWHIFKDQSQARVVEGA